MFKDIIVDAMEHARRCEKEISTKKKKDIEARLQLIFQPEIVQLIEGGK